MIMQWKRQKNGDYHAKWQTMSLRLSLNKATRMWGATIADTSSTEYINDAWHTAIMAMDAIDAMQQKIVQAQMAKQAAKENNTNGN